MDRYFISTDRGYIMTNDEKMSAMPFSIDEMIADPSVLCDPDQEPCKIFFVTKNDKDYWEFGEYVGNT